MEVKATRKFVRGSAFKMRQVTRLIQGKTYEEAYNLTKFTNKKAAFFLHKLLISAKANVENNNNFKGQLIVKEAIANEGPTMKRYKAKARGSAGRINKRTSHLTVVLSDQF